MDPITGRYLHEAASRALKDEQHLAAMELLKLFNWYANQDLSHEPVRALRAVSTPVALMPSDGPVRTVQGPAREYTFWMSLIRDKFIPFMLSNGRYRFTACDLLKYIENREEIRFTTGDEEIQRNTRKTWRVRVTNALYQLKENGCLVGEGRRRYVIPSGHSHIA
jgi:hypothetical protein